MFILGFSLNDFYFWPKMRLDFLLKKIKQEVPQANAVELNAFWPIKEILKSLNILRQYQFRSFHLVKNNCQQQLSDLNKLQNVLKLDQLIIHPQDVKNWSKLEQSVIPIVVENMDNHKKRFRTIKEIAGLFQQYPFLKLCLDVNHMTNNFPGQNQTGVWLNAFKGRIKEIHLAAPENDRFQNFFKGNKPRHHLCFDVGISLDKKIKKYPIILEGALPPQKWHLAKKEFAWVKNCLK